MHNARTAHGYFTTYCANEGNFSTALINRLSLMLDVSHERRQLRKLDLAALKDMGLDPSEVAHEVARPFWDLPKNRICQPK